MQGCRKGKSPVNLLKETGGNWTLDLEISAICISLNQTLKGHQYYIIIVSIVSKILSDVYNLNSVYLTDITVHNHRRQKRSKERV